MNATPKEPAPVSTVSPDIATSELFAGEGEMRVLMRSFDWASTGLGPTETWSPTLRTISQMLLSNSFPMLLWWGPDFIQLYNDAYIPVLGDKHWHKALGKPFRECWSEVYHVLGPLAEGPFHGGPPTWIDDIPVELNRYSYKEEAHFTISYSPVPDPSAPGGIGGVIAIVNETSAKVVSGRRVLALRDLASRSAEAKSAEEACAEAAIILASYRKDAPFVLLYLLDEEQKIATLSGRAEADGFGALYPESISLQDPSAVWPFQQVLKRDEVIVVPDLASRFGQMPPGPWSDPPDSAAIIPIQSQIARQLSGFLIVGISPRLRFDDDYRGFLELAGGQIATTIANARAYEMERRRNEALAEIDRAKTTFFSNISHELRTPLTLMTGPIEDMLANSSGVNSEDRERLELAHRNSLRMLKLVNALLEFSRIEAGGLKARFTPVDLAALTADLVSMFRAATERAGIALTVDCTPLTRPVLVDRDMWERIILNLLSNALKSTFEGEITVRLQEQQGNAIVSVSDTGTGISPDQLPHIFERFRRIEGARRRTNEGSGIGLALVNELVALHQGTISVESEVGAGATFTITLPLAPPNSLAGQAYQADQAEPDSRVALEYMQEALGWLPDTSRSDLPEFSPAKGDANTSSASADAGASKATVLLADDNRDMRNYLKRLLQPRFHVTTASNGREALDLIRKGPPDLVLTDVMMPELDGFELVEKLRADPDTRAIPIIVLSARAGEESRADGLLAGADDYLVKPFTARELVARVESHIRNAQFRRETAQALRRAEQLATAGRLAASIAHELNNPLEAVTNLLFLCASDPELSASSREMLGAADRELRRLTHIASTSLKFYRQPSAAYSVSIAEILDRVLYLNEARLRALDLKVEKEYAIVPRVVCSGGEIQQVLANLISNAIDSMSPHQRLKLRIAASKTRDPLGGPGVAITIADTGRGIDKQTQAKIFEPFFTTKSDVGTGLGLWVVKSIIEKHNGSIRFSSAPDRGTVFRVVLPLGNSLAAAS